MHMKIRRDPSSREFQLSDFPKKFLTIPEMVHHYTLNRLPIKGAEHMCLKKPIAIELLLWTLIWKIVLFTIIAIDWQYILMTSLHHIKNPLHHHSCYEPLTAAGASGLYFYFRQLWAGPRWSSKLSSCADPLNLWVNCPGRGSRITEIKNNLRYSKAYLAKNRFRQNILLSVTRQKIRQIVVRYVLLC